MGSVDSAGRHPAGLGPDRPAPGDRGGVGLLALDRRGDDPVAARARHLGWPSRVRGTARRASSARRVRQRGRVASRRSSGSSATSFQWSSPAASFVSSAGAIVGLSTTSSTPSASAAPWRSSTRGRSPRASAAQRRVVCRSVGRHVASWIARRITRPGTMSCPPSADGQALQERRPRRAVRRASARGSGAPPSGLEGQAASGVGRGGRSLSSGTGRGAATATSSRARRSSSAAQDE
jgi:hypothetical protein